MLTPPWDTPNPHTIEIRDSSSGNVVYNTAQLDYTFSSKPIVLPSPGTYNIVDKSYDTKEAKITVLDDVTSSGNSIVGGFYTDIENTEDNDGGLKITMVVHIQAHFNIIKRRSARMVLIF